MSDPIIKSADYEFMLASGEVARILIAIRKEREACAKLVESMAPTEYVRRIAAAIRARK